MMGRQSLLAANRDELILDVYLKVSGPVKEFAPNEDNVGRTYPFQEQEKQVAPSFALTKYEIKPGSKFLVEPETQAPDIQGGSP